MSRNVYNGSSSPNDNTDSNQNDGGGLPEGWQPRSPSERHNLPPELTREEMREQQRIANQIREDRRRRLEPSNGQAGGTEQQWGNGAGAFDRSVRQRTSSLQQYHLNSEPNGPILVNQDLNPIGDQNDMRQDARSNNVQDQRSFDELAMDQTTTQTEVRSIFQEQMQIHNQERQQHLRAMQIHQREMQRLQQEMQDTNHQTQEVLNQTREILDQIQRQANRPSTPVGHINLQEAPSTPPNQIVPTRLTREQVIRQNRNAENMGMIPRGPKEDQSGNEERNREGRGI